MKAYWERGGKRHTVSTSELMDKSGHLDDLASREIPFRYRFDRRLVIAKHHVMKVYRDCDVDNFEF